MVLLVGQWGEEGKTAERVLQSTSAPHCLSPDPASTKRSPRDSVGQGLTQELGREDAPPRTLVLEYWGRTDQCLERKWAHMDMVDELFESREELILATTLSNAETALEPNMFPYDTPEGIEHWTLWSRHEMDGAEIEEYVCNWLRENAPHVESWNYDENPSRSIDIFHVHVYLLAPAQPRSPRVNAGSVLLWSV